MPIPPLGGAHLAFAIFAAPLPAAADAPSVDLTWTAPGDCPSGAEVERIVASQLPAGARVKARGDVARVGDRFRLVLEIASRGTRVLEAASCRELATSTAVIIAISQSKSASDPASIPDEPSSAERPNEPSSLEENAEPRSSGAAPSPPPSERSDSTHAPTSEEPEPPERRTSDEHPEEATPAAPKGRIRPVVRADATVDAGMLASPAAGIGVAAGFEASDRIHVEAFGAAFFAQDTTIAEAPARGARLQMFTAGLRGCVSLTRGVELAPCLGVSLARLTASSFGSVRNGEATSNVWAPEALIGLRVPIAGPMSVRVATGLSIPLSRQSFIVTALGTAHRPSAVAFHGFVGPEVRF